MKNTIKQILPKLILLLILLNFSNKSFSQANCFNNDTLYFDNEVDIPICLSIECTSSSSVPVVPVSLIDFIQNDIPIRSQPSNCPNTCGSSGYISCGTPVGHQLGKIVLKHNSTLPCPNIKISIVQVLRSTLYPAASVYTLGGPTTAIINNCLGCGTGLTPNLEMTLDCNTKTLHLKCVQ